MTEEELAEIEREVGSGWTLPGRVDAYALTTIIRLVTAVRRLREENEQLRAVLQRTDSRLSLLRHRGGIQWGTPGIGDASEVDEVIGEARRLLEPPGRHEP